mmetsp:Transcript_138082/g.253988  ORF Transcript_138082/g.253988 Transcript_138082/m.253988 type:complete len:230 (-) Transcript_138082:1743-2432(-)
MRLYFLIHTWRGRGRLRIEFLWVTHHLGMQRHELEAVPPLLLHFLVSHGSHETEFLDLGMQERKTCCLILRLVSINRWDRQLLEVNLATRCARPLVYANTSRGYHVVWKYLATILGNLICGSTGGCHICNEALQTPWCILKHLDHALTHPWNLSNRTLNLTQFNPDATDFDLVVCTPNINHMAISPPLDNIASAVDDVMLAIVERILNESLGSLLGQIQVTPPHLHTAN